MKERFEKFEKPVMEKITFEAEDIIVTSGCSGDCRRICSTDCITVCQGVCHEVTQ